MQKWQIWDNNRKSNYEWSQRLINTAVSAKHQTKPFLPVFQNIHLSMDLHSIFQVTGGQYWRNLVPLSTLPTCGNWKSLITSGGGGNPRGPPATTPSHFCILWYCLQSFFTTGFCWETIAILFSSACFFPSSFVFCETVNVKLLLRFITKLGVARPTHQCRSFEILKKNSPSLTWRNSWTTPDYLVYNQNPLSETDCHFCWAYKHLKWPWTVGALSVEMYQIQ